MAEQSVVSGARRRRRHFERLPPELQRAIFKQLDYATLILLSQVNRHFHQTVDPQMAPVLDKQAFVMRAERDFHRHFPQHAADGRQEHPGNFGCYVCYRIRAPEYFDAKPPSSVPVDSQGRVVQASNVKNAAARTGKATVYHVTLRRFCIDCGIRCRLYMPGDLFVTKMRQDLWVCLCCRVWAKPTFLRCDTCGADCPLRARIQPP